MAKFRIRYVNDPDEEVEAMSFNLLGKEDQWIMFYKSANEGPVLTVKSSAVSRIDLV